MTNKDKHIDSGEECPDDFILVNNGKNAQEGECKQCPMSYFKSSAKRCGKCPGGMTSIFGSTGKEQCFERELIS